MITYATRFHEAVLPFADEPQLVVAGLACHSGLRPYVVYENGDEWSFAGGCLAGIGLARDGAEIRKGARVRQLPASVRPLDAVERFAASVAARGWRAYGWAPFGSSASFERDTRDALLLFVPEVEVRAAGDGVLVRCADERDLVRTAELLRHLHEVRRLP